MKKHWRLLANLLPDAIERKVYKSHFNYEHKLWQAKGHTAPSSHLLKQQAIATIAKQHNIKILVETGTYMGDMVYAMLPVFEKIYSIELSEFFYTKAQKRFRKYKKVKLVFGDSAEKLKEIVNKLNQPALFWLDGHYSGGNTALGKKQCPVFEELESIFTSTLTHVIIIDDARCFVGENDYPTIPELNNFIKQHWSDAFISIVNDSIMVLPKKKIDS